MRTAWILLALLLVASAGLAGCLGDQDEPLSASETSPADDSVQAGGASDEGRMTAEASESTDEGVRAEAPPFYAERTVTIEGVLTLPALPAELVVEDGEISVETGPAGEYGVEVRLTGYGATPTQAQEERDRLSLDWDIGEPGDRRLFVEATEEDDDGEDGGRAEATVNVVLPEPLVADLRATVTNGEITVEDLRARLLRAQTTNGAVRLAGVTADTVELGTTNGKIAGDVAGTRDVDVTSTNGKVELVVEPGATGRLEATSTNGQVDVAVPEDDAHGYRAEATSTNGQVDIRLEDGSEEESGGPGSQQATFLTHGYDQRPIRTDVGLTVTNGDVVLRPS